MKREDCIAGLIWIKHIIAEEPGTILNVEVNKEAREILEIAAKALNGDEDE